MLSGARDLRLLAGAVLLSAAGDLILMIALALQVHEVSGSGLAVSAFFATLMLPTVLLAPVAGMIADRFESVRVLALASLAQAVVACALAVAVDELAALLALSALLSAGSAISQPAEFALVPLVAGGEDRLVHANGAVESARYAGFAVGPLAAAALVAGAGIQVALLVDALSFVAIAGAAVALRVRRPPAPATHGEPRVRAREGLHVLLGDRLMRATLVPVAVGLLFISATLTIEVFYAHDVLGVGDVGYAALIAAWTAGMVVGSSKLATRVPPRALAGAALVALGVQGFGVAVQTAWAVLPFALAGYLVGGLGHGAKNPLLRTLIHRRVPERTHGRAFAVYNAVRNTAELCALAAGGVLVGALGASDALLIAGLGTVLAALAGLLWLRRPGPAAMGEPVPAPA